MREQMLAAMARRVRRLLRDGRITKEYRAEVEAELESGISAHRAYELVTEVSTFIAEARGGQPKPGDRSPSGPRPGVTQTTAKGDVVHKETGEVYQEGRKDIYG